MLNASETTMTSHYLKCFHCGADFLATKSQWKHRHSREGSCSRACVLARIAKANTKEKILYGPCPTCGKKFTSRVKKTFCSMKCYTKSPAFCERLAAWRKKGWERNAHLKTNLWDYRNCLECKLEFKVKPGSSKKFCSHLHYRQFMEKRFDRWIASPQEVALPQAYDEFMIQEELPCIIEGCSWKGHHLGGHIQRAHGLIADDFKRAAGFNLTTGLVSPSLHQILVDTNSGKGLSREQMSLMSNRSSRVKNYVSLEGKEHAAKARLLVGNGPERVCPSCSKPFLQTSPFGKTKYCSIECRETIYRLKKKQTKTMGKQP